MSGLLQQIVGPALLVRANIDERPPPLDQFLQGNERPARRPIGWLLHTRNVTRISETSGKKRGVWGISYPGFQVAVGMIDAHPALKAASPQAPIADWFVGDDYHHNGALYLPHAFIFLALFGRPRTGPRTDMPSE